MAAIAGRLGEFWAAIDINLGPPVVVSDCPQPTGGVPASDPEAQATPVNGNFGIILESLVDTTLNGNVDELETTVHNTGGQYTVPPITVDHNTARQYIPNFHDETLDLTLRYDEEDPCQRNLLYAAMGSNLFWYWFFPDGPGFMGAVPASNTRAFFGAAFSTSFSPGAPLDDVATLDLTLRLSGTIMEVTP
jgi:hypothetical protein